MTPGNLCGTCDANCDECEDLTGKCYACKSGYMVRSGKCVEKSSDCVYEYGPPTDPAGCLPYKADDYRLIPEYPKSATEVDWRDWGVVSPNRRQGGCGSCWAFGAIAPLETWHAIVHGPLYHLSE